MGHSVILTPQALEDLKSIVSFIARDNPDRARSFGDELIDKALTLTNQPLRGRIVPELKDQNVREIIHAPYRIIYETLNETPKAYICSKVSIPRAFNPCFSTFEVRSQSTRRLSRVTLSLLRTGQCS